MRYLRSVVKAVAEAQAAAQSLGLEIATLEIRRAGDIVPAFESLKDHADALYVTADALLNANRIRINTLALGARLPDDACISRIRRGGRPDVLWTKSRKYVPARRRVGRQDFARDEARRYPGRAAD